MWPQFLRFLCAFYLLWDLYVQAEDIIDCSSQDVVTSIFNEPIELDFNGTIRRYDNVTIDGLLTTSNNEFAVNYIDARLETESTERINQTNLIIYTTEFFPNYAHEQRETRITLKITLACSGGRERSLILFQPILEKNYFSPIFTRDVYEILLPTPIFAGLDLTYFVEISAQDDDLTKNRVIFSSLEARNHSIEVGTKNSTGLNGRQYFANITLLQPFISFKENFTFVITATDEDTPPRNATATVIVRPDPLNQYPAIPEFEELLYICRLSENFTLLEPLNINLVNESYNNEIVFSLNGTAEHLFQMKLYGNGVNLSLAYLLTTQDVEGKDELSFELQARHPKLSNYGRTMVVVLMPKKLSDNGDDNNFRFIRNIYEGFIDSTNKLELDSLIFEPISYTSEVEFKLRGPHADYFVLLQSGHVLSLNILPIWPKRISNERLLTVEVVATRQQLTASTTVLIRTSNESEDYPSPEGQVPFVLIVKEIEEEKVHTDIMNIKHGNCSYRITAIYPNNKPYVWINEFSQMLESIAIDREDEIFANMSKPQIRVELQLECESHSSRRKRQAPSFLYSDVLANDIPGGWDTTILNLIIVDVNDNPPMFVFPIDSPSYIGYPDSTIIFELFPEYLTQVRAIDRDVGQNAKLRFSMQANEYFDIDPSTGIIFPTNPIQIENSTKLLISATDRDGAEDGLRIATVIEVKRLNADHVTLLTYEANKSESLESTLKNMGKQMDVELGSIRSALLPGNGRRKAVENSLQQVWIYGFKAETPLLCNELQDKMNNQVNNELTPMGFIVQSFDEVGLDSNHSYVDNDSNKNIERIIYLTTIAVLGVISLVLLYFLLRNQTGMCCGQPAVNSIATPAVVPNHGTCSPCSQYPSIVTNIQPTCMEEKPEVLVAHMTNGVSVEFQIGDDQNCENSTSKRQSVAVSPRSNAMLRELM